VSLFPGIGASPRVHGEDYVPGAPVNLFVEPHAPNDGVGGYGNMSIRQLCKPLTNSGRQFRFTFYNGQVCPHVSFELQDPGFLDYRTSLSPAEILFGGNHGIPGGNGYASEIVSDWIELWHPIGAGDQVIVIFDLGTFQGTTVGANSVDGTTFWNGLKHWTLNGAASYAQAAPGGSWNVNNNILVLVKKIEVR
jgi:hypothetical protein